MALNVPRADSFRTDNGKLPQEAIDALSRMDESALESLKLSKDEMKIVSAEKKRRDANDKAEKRFIQNWLQYKKAMFLTNNPKMAKIANKTTELWGKFGKPFFKGMTNFFKNMSLSKATGILGFLLGLFIMIKLGLLDTLIPAALALLGTLIAGLIRALPVIIKALSKILFEVIPGVLKQIFNAILDVLEVPADSPLRAIADFLADIAPYVIILVAVGYGIVQVISAINAVMAVMAVLSGPVGLVVLAIGILIVYLMLLWKYSDKIVAFFEGLWEKFKKLGIIGKIITAILAVVLVGIFPVIPIIYGLAKLFQSFKKIGVVETFKLIWKTITDFIKNLYTTVADFFVMIVTTIKKAFITAMKFLGKLIKKWFFIAFINPVNTVIKIFKRFKDAIMGIVNVLSDLFSGKIGMKDAMKKVGGIILDLATGLAKEIGSAVGKVFDTLGGPFSKLKDMFLNMFSGIQMKLASNPVTRRLFNLDTYGEEKDATTYRKLSGATSDLKESKGRISELIRKGGAGSTPAEVAYKDAVLKQLGERSATEKNVPKAIEELVKAMKEGKKDTAATQAIRTFALNDRGPK